MIKRIFLDHPHTVDESFSQHFVFAMTFALRLLLAAAAACVHALVPCLFEKTASRIIADLYHKTSTRGQ